MLVVHLHGIKVGTGFIQQQDSCPTEDRSSQTHQLLVTIAQHVTSVFKLEIQLIWKLLNHWLKPDLKNKNKWKLCTQGLQLSMLFWHFLLQITDRLVYNAEMPWMVLFFDRQLGCVFKVHYEQKVSANKWVLWQRLASSVTLHSSLSLWYPYGSRLIRNVPVKMKTFCSRREVTKPKWEDFYNCVRTK